MGPRAVPLAIIGDLHLDLTDAQWVNSLYAVLLAALLLSTGNLADRWGRKRLFLTGSALIAPYPRRPAAQHPLCCYRFGVHFHATAGVRGRLLPLASHRRLVAMNDMHSLGRLIASAQERNGWSLRDLAARADRAGYDMSHASFARLKSTPVTSIKGENITMLALVLRVPVAHVVTAALESIGVELDSALHPSVLDVVQESPDLSTYDQELLAAVLRVMLDRRRTDHHDERDHADQDQDRERGTAERGGARGGDAGAEQKTAAADAPADFDLAAHPDFELTRDRQAREWGDVGEENQDPGDEAGA